MRQIHEPSRITPVMAETDVLVVGGGPGGLSAAREGVETMLVERYGCFGGNITQAMLEPIARYRHENTIDAGGIGVEFERRAKEMGGTCNDLESLGRIPEPGGEDLPCRQPTDAVLRGHGSGDRSRGCGLGQRRGNLQRGEHVEGPAGSREAGCSHQIDAAPAENEKGRPRRLGFSRSRV
jgi:hypothetical protein